MLAAILQATVGYPLAMAQDIVKEGTPQSPVDTTLLAMAQHTLLAHTLLMAMDLPTTTTTTMVHTIEETEANKPEEEAPEQINPRGWRVAHWAILSS